MAASNQPGVASGSPSFDVERDGVAVLTFDAPERSHNVLSSEVMRRLDDALRDLEREAAAGRARALVVRSGKPGSFIPGADVREIAAIDDPAEARAKAAEGQRIFSRLAALPIPSVAAVNGICLGGGTELILACSRRIAADSDAVRIGLPETRLGIIPGFGGTTRLPRLIGVRAAAELIASGKPVSARRAHGIGLVDERVPPELLDQRASALAR
ncbi:MAG: enoyl-CoA hydratase-related protein, partial [Longimicrobiales bacterium]